MILEPIIRVTHDGSWRVTESGYPATGSTRITGMAELPEVDVDEVIHAHFPGIVVQKNLVDAITLWLLEHGTVTADDVAAIVALANAILAVQVRPPTLPTTQDNYGPVPYPSGMPRWPHSNPTPAGWTIVDDGTVVSGGSP